MSNFSFVQVDQFQPSVSGWNIIDRVTYQQINPTTILLSTADQHQVQFSFLSDSAFRVRFNPSVNPNYAPNQSNAVVNYDLGSVSLALSETQEDGGTLVIQTGNMTVKIGLNHYGYAVFDATGQLVTSTVYGRNLVYSNQAVASLHNAPNPEIGRAHV